MKPLYKMTLSALLVAVGTLAGHILYIPLGVTRIFPVQHILNVLGAVILGPFYTVGNAFAISLLRNLLGTGSIFAFPGSMIGALLAGLMFIWFKSPFAAAVGEIFGTGILGALVSFPIARFVLGQDLAAGFFVIPFLLSTTCGSLIACVLLKIFALNPRLSHFLKGVEK